MAFHVQYQVQDTSGSDGNIRYRTLRDQVAFHANIRYRTLRDQMAFHANIRYRTLQNPMAFHVQCQVQDTLGSRGISCRFIIS